MNQPETRHEKRLLAEWDKFQAEFRALRELQARQIDSLYAQYKPTLDSLSFMVSVQRWTDDDDPETY